MSPVEGPLDPSTLAVHLGRPPAEAGRGVNPPMAMSVTYRAGGPLIYGRDGNETWEALEEVVGALEGGRALVFGSGMGAIAAVLDTLPSPGRVVVAGDAYAGTRRHLVDAAARGRLRFQSVEVADTGATLGACTEVARWAEGQARPGAFGSGGLLWLESPTNPLLAVADLSELCAGAHALGMDVAVDNTFATPLLQRPLDLGADVVVHSGTKYISGHSDVLLGVAVTARPEVLELLRTRRSLHGAVAGSFEAWLALRGLRTLSVRLERAEHNAGVLARRLATHPRVTRVYYPGLPDDPGHGRALRQMKGFGAVVSFEVSGGAAGADAVVDALSLITPGTSLGGVETLIERRARVQGEEALPPSLLRLSVGIEHAEDLWADLARGLSTPS